MWRQFSKVFIVVLTLIGGFSLPAYSEPGVAELEAADDPLLRAIWHEDFSLNREGTGSQALAEQNYLLFLERNPNHELAPYLFFRLGNLFSGGVSPTIIKEGRGVIDHRRAYDYFNRCVEVHPPDKISQTLVDARICAASLSKTLDDSVDEYIEVIKWLEAIPESDVADKLWISQRQSEIISQQPYRRELWAKAFEENRKSLLEVSKANLLANAMSGGNRSTDAAKAASDRLNKVEERLPGVIDPNDLSKARKSLAVVQSGSSIDASQNRRIVIIIVNVTTLLVVVGVSFYWRRRTERLSASDNARSASDNASKK